MVQPCRTTLISATYNESNGPCREQEANSIWIVSSDLLSSDVSYRGISCRPYARQSGIRSMFPNHGAGIMAMDHLPEKVSFHEVVETLLYITSS